MRARRGWRRTAAAGLAAGLLAVAGCGGSPAPKPGQAVLLGTYDTDSTVGLVLDSFYPLGAASTDSGTTYFLNSPLMVGLGPTGKGTPIAATGSYFGGPILEGLVAMPDGSLLFGYGAEVVRLDPKTGATSVLVGDAERTRDETAPPSATATPADVRFTIGIDPIGVTRSGAVLITDGRALWSLAAGRLTLVYQQPAPAKGQANTLIGRGSATTADGTAYIRAMRGSHSTLADVLVVSPNGKPTKLALPHSIPGVHGDPADLVPTWITSDDANGVYVHAEQSSPGDGDYVLHLHDGTATLAMSAKPPATTARTSTCHVHDPADATRFPCALPTAMSYHDGQLTLVGEELYAVRLQVDPAPRDTPRR